MNTLSRFLCKSLLKTSSVLRKPISKLLFKLVEKKIPVEKPGSWAKYVTMPTSQFDDIMGKLKYKSDPFMSIFDYTLYNLDLLFNNEDTCLGNSVYGRDCDDAALAWYEFAKHKGLETWQIMMMNGWNVKASHLATVFKRNDDKYILCNWRMLPIKFDTLEAAVDAFRTMPLQASGKYENLTWVIYSHCEEKV
jgi:hypothetical protein